MSAKPSAASRPASVIPRGMLTRATLASGAQQQYRVGGEPVLDHVVIADHVRQRRIGVHPRGPQRGLDPVVAWRQCLGYSAPAPGPAGVQACR